MSIKKEPSVFGLIGFLAGCVITFLIISSQPPKVVPVYTTTQNSQTPVQPKAYSGDMTTTMMNMAGSLKGKEGDDFDRVFLEQMIEHHMGAIDMANDAKSYGKHDEIRKMAEYIITSQSVEIEQMNKWQKQWNYIK